MRVTTAMDTLTDADSAPILEDADGLRNKSWVKKPRRHLGFVALVIAVLTALATLRSVRTEPNKVRTASRVDSDSNPSDHVSHNTAPKTSSAHPIFKFMALSEEEKKRVFKMNCSIWIYDLSKTVPDKVKTLWETSFGPDSILEPEDILGGALEGAGDKKFSNNGGDTLQTFGCHMLKGVISGLQAETSLWLAKKKALASTAKEARFARQLKLNDARLKTLKNTKGPKNVITTLERRSRSLTKSLKVAGKQAAKDNKAWATAGKSATKGIAAAGAVLGQFGAGVLADKIGVKDGLGKELIEAVGAVGGGVIAGAAQGALFGSVAGPPGAAAGAAIGVAVGVGSYVVGEFVDAFGNALSSYDGTDNTACTILKDDEPMNVYTYKKADNWKFKSYTNVLLSSRDQQECVSAGQEPHEEFRLYISTSGKAWFVEPVIFDKLVKGGDTYHVFSDEAKLYHKPTPTPKPTSTTTPASITTTTPSITDKFFTRMLDPQLRKEEAEARLHMALSRLGTGCGQSLEGYAIEGNNIEGSSKAENHLGCALACAATRNCKGWTWRKDNGTCWLKDRVITVLDPSEHDVSGYCLQTGPGEQLQSPESHCGNATQNSDNGGTKMTDGVSSSKDWVTCRNRCALKTGCKGWTWKENLQECWLKSEISPQASSDTDSMSGSCSHQLAPARPPEQKPAPAVQCNSPHFGKDNLGENLDAGESCTDWQTCRSRCQKLAGWCKGWVWKKTERCWLKSRTLPSFSDPLAVSGDCVCEMPPPIFNCSSPVFTQDLAGGILHKNLTFTQNWEDCQTSCQAKPWCKGWTWKFQSHECWLNLQASEGKKSLGSISGYCHESWSRDRCAGSWKGCFFSKCCKDPKQRCFKKNHHWAQCRDSCTSGIDDYDRKMGKHVGNWSCEPWDDTLSCAESWEGCLKSRCCKDPKQRCFKKNHHWAQCRDSCKPGLDEHDTKMGKHVGNWSCELLDDPPPPCAGSWEGCLKSQCCKDPKQRCFKKNHHWAQCRDSCKPGLDERDKQIGKHVGIWSCEKIDNTLLPATCSADKTENCLTTRCCANSGSKCFKKDDRWAACNTTCAESIYHKDPQQHQQKWKCDLL